MTIQEKAALINESEHVMTSDYFSFIGADSQGHIAFAIDNNRYRNRDSYRAEHTYVVLHDQQQGWQPVSGRGHYENSNRDLIRIPDSTFFQFAGQPATGLTISSSINHLTLEIDAIPERVPYGDDDSIFYMGSAPAVLTWNERIIHGRVIYEYLVKRDFNFMKNLGEFQGLYLLADAASDLYVHRTFMEIVKTMPAVLGFSLIGGEFEQFGSVQFEATKRVWTPGLYRWPKMWRVAWEGRNGPASLKLELVTHKLIGNWVVAGFSMGIVRGELSYDGRQIPVYGLAELIMISRLARTFARFKSTKSGFS